MNWKTGVLAAGAMAAIAAIGAMTGGCTGSTTTVVYADSGTNCGAGATECGGTCTVVARDAENCGACGKKCAAGELCSAGTCAASCQSGTTKCGTECVDTKSDSRNCGTCGTKCSGIQVCNAGACANSCTSGLTTCGSACVDTQTDRTNCGGCGTMCKDGEVCSAGKCEISCQAGLTKCSIAPSDGGVSDAAADGASDGGLGSTYCANLVADNTNCGTCGKVCAPGQKCVSGQCANAPISVQVFPPTGTLVDPGSTSVWGGRYYTMTFATATTIVGLSWRANLATADSMRAEIWDPANSTKLATGSTVNGNSVQAFYTSDISFAFAAAKPYLVGVFMSNANTVFPRKDSPSFPFTVAGVGGNINVTACWSTSTANTDIFPTSVNVWGPDFRLLLQ